MVTYEKAKSTAEKAKKTVKVNHPIKLLSICRRFAIPIHPSGGHFNVFKKGSTLLVKLRIAELTTNRIGSTINHDYYR
jgi:hypothetical protein